MGVKLGKEQQRERHERHSGPFRFVPALSVRRGCDSQLHETPHLKLLARNKDHRGSRRDDATMGKPRRAKMVIVNIMLGTTSRQVARKSGMDSAATSPSNHSMDNRMCMFPNKTRLHDDKPSRLSILSLAWDHECQHGTERTTWEHALADELVA